MGEKTQEEAALELLEELADDLDRIDVADWHGPLREKLDAIADKINLFLANAHPPVSTEELEQWAEYQYEDEEEDEDTNDRGACGSCLTHECENCAEQDFA